MSGSARSREVLWWGRFDPGYSRNAVIRDAFAALNWRSRSFCPQASRLGFAESRLRGIAPADLVWVPCFRQRDIAAAARFAALHGIPLIVDPLISAYDKQVGERAKYAPDSAQARRLLHWERSLLGTADRVVVDTHGHADYFASTLGVDPGVLHVVPVGAEERHFRSAPAVPASVPAEALFYGSFLPLQGAHIIVEAARHLRTRELNVTLLGDGPEHARCVALAADRGRVRFEPWIPYDELPARIHRAALLLGVFGETPKAGRVIPNKVYQALACARPVVTRSADSYPADLRRTPTAGIRFVPPGDAVALAGALDAFFADPSRFTAASDDARRVYQRWFSAERIRGALCEVLESLGLGEDSAQ